MKTRADQRVQLRQLAGQGMALIAALAAVACQSERPTGPQTPTTTTTFQGVLAGPLGESGVITLTTGTGAAGAVAAQRVGAAASSAVTENLSGRLLIIGSASIDLTGTLNTATGAIAVSGGGYSFTGSVTDSKLSGTYTGPNGAGTFTGLSSTASTPTFVSYCGTSSGTDNFGGTPQPRSGAFNLERSGSLLFGVAVDNSPTGADVPVAMVTGQVTGNSVSLTVTDLNGNPVGSATGTISATAASGTYTSSDGLATGTWSASTASCSQSTAAEFTIAPNFVASSAAFDATNYLVGMQDQTARNTNNPGVFAQFVSSTGVLAGPVLGPLGPSGNHVGDPPCVAFGASNYLMGWAGNFSQTGGDILGQLVPIGGSQAGAGFAITSTHDASSTGGIVFGGGTYFVAYERTSGLLHKIYGRFVSPDGTVGSEFPISSGFGQEHDDICHQVAFDGTNFLVVWIEESSEASLNNMTVKARFVSPSGALGAEVAVNGQGPTKTAAGVAYNGSTYFVTWNAVIDPAAYDYDFLGQLVTPTGALSGGVIPIATGSAFQYGQVSAGGGNFLVLWDYFQSTLASAAIKGKIFDGSGTPVGAERTLFAQAADGRVPSLGAEVFNGRDYLVVLGRATAPANPFDFGAYTNWSVDGAFITPWGGATLPVVSGTYRGTITFTRPNIQPFTLPATFVLAQSGTSVTGTWSIQDALSGNVVSTGTISGTISGAVLGFTVTGDGACDGTAAGSATIDNPGGTLSGSSSGSDCQGPVSTTFLLNHTVSVASVIVTPATANIAPGGTVQLTATTKDAAGNVLTGRAVTWVTSNAAVATVSASGLVTGVASGGPVTITATSEGKSGTGAVTVSALAGGTHFAAVWGSSGTDVFAVASDGTIWHYDGTTWGTQASAPTFLNGVWGTSALDVFAVGGSGTILHYDGTSWTPQASGTVQHLEGVWGSGGVDVFAVGFGGTILHYDGTGWSAQASGTTQPLYRMWGSAGTDVFAVGFGGTILHYNGASWSPQASGTTAFVTTIWGTQGADVFAAGSGGMILHYDGTAWSAQVSGTTQSLYGVWGSAGTDIFAVGRSGTILHYNGTSWSAQVSGTTQDLSGVWGSGGTDVFAVGAGGTILHYNGTAWSSFGNPTAVTFALLTAGGIHTCGLTSGGTAYCWGANSTGELGNNSTTDSPVPVAVTGSLVFTSVSAGHGTGTGQTQTCGVTSAGAAYCWGYNGNGQLGNNTTTDSPIPVAVAGGLLFSSVSSGQFHTCGLTTAGAAYCWGGNGRGQLGNNTTTDSPVPVAVGGSLTFSSISSGNEHTCGLISGGVVYCWGRNDEGELGTNNTTGSTAPIAVAGSLTFSSLSTGQYHTCGLTNGGAVYCWGWNTYGQLGDGTTTGPQQCVGGLACSTTPVAIAGSLVFSSVSSGLYHTCGFTASGAAYCWGRGNEGQLGNNSTTDSPVPVTVAGGLTFGSLTAGGHHNCGLTTGGLAYCWGASGHGQLGSGSTTGSSVPVKVAGQP